MTTPEDSKTTRGSVLTVDDDALILRGYLRLLEPAGFHVETAPSAKAALEMIRVKDFDVVLSDIWMPGMNGIDFLREVRRADSDLPVVIATAYPAVDTAIKAVEYGAFRYLLKPFDAKELEAVLTQASHFSKLARLKREATDFLRTADLQVDDRRALEQDFMSAIELAWMAYQPIVSTSKKEILGYEALFRTKEPSIPHPGAMLDAAEKLDQLHLVGQRVRTLIARDIGSELQWDIFVNLHPSDLVDEDLYASDSKLAANADRIVLEITERAALDVVKDVSARITELKEMGFRIAVDDLGSGYAGLSSLAQLDPDVVKIDMSIVRDVHLEPVKQKLIRSMVPLCKDMNVMVVVEGVETVEEKNVLEELGCDIMQGYFFAKPGAPFPEVGWG